jgi:hypothetical protein
MSTEANDTSIPPDVMADMQAVADAVAAGRRIDPEMARRVKSRADQVRADILAAHGLQDIGVQIIRDIRGD